MSFSRDQGQIWSNYNTSYPNEVTAVGHISPVMKAILHFDQILGNLNSEMPQVLLQLQFSSLNRQEIAGVNWAKNSENKEKIEVNILTQNMQDKICRSESVGQNLQDNICRTISVGQNLQDKICRTKSVGQNLQDKITLSTFPTKCVSNNCVPLKNKMLSSGTKF